MPSNKYRIIGRVVDQYTLEGLSGARVEAWVKAQLTTPARMLKETETAEDGLFRIEFEKSDLDQLALRGKIIVFFKLYHDGDLIKNTESSVMLIPGPGEHTIDDMHVAISPMQPDTYKITGHVTTDDPEQTVAGINVQALGKASPEAEGKPITATQTNKDGGFLIDFKTSELAGLGLPHKLQLYFNLSYNSELLTGTEDSTIEINGPGKHNVGEIKLVNQYKVSGHVLWPDGRPFTGTEIIGKQNEEKPKPNVKAFNKLIREEVLLGSADIDNKGYYEIIYNPPVTSPQEKDRPNLILRVYDENGEEIAATDVTYNAKSVEKVDLVVGNEEYKGPPEYQRLMEALSPFIKDLELSGLTDEDIEFLAAKTALASEQIIHLILAFRYATQTELPPEVFYGLFRQNFPTRLPALIAQNPDILKTALETAVKDNIVPETIPAEQVLERFQELVVDHAFEPLEPLPAGKTTLGELIGSVQITQQQQREFLNLYVSHQGTIEEFWHELEETDLQSSVQELQYTLQLGVLTGNYLPLVLHIKQLEPTPDLRDLAGLKVGDWKGKIETYGFPSDVPGKDDEEKTENYAQTIVRMIEDAFPTAVISHKVEDDNEFPGNKEDLVRFFNNSPDFEFGATQIDRYLQQNTSALVSIEDQDGMVRQLKTMDRLFRVSPRFERYEAIKVLMENGFNSAQSIAMMGQRSFSARYAEKLGNYHKAKAIYTHAAQMTAMTLAVHTKYSHAFNQPGMTVLPDIAKKIQDIPNWETQFGPFKLCDCEHCKSVLSPSAYLVDLLAFLRQHNLVKHVSGPYNAVNSALGVLSDRRRDIEHINLSCANANTLVPYVDLVNEILENAVPPYKPVYYQTTGTADELGANPEYLKVDAYDTLAKAIYPWSLPFDLWTEESRTYLNHLGVSRYTLLETFQKNGESPMPTDLALASEYLGFTIKEQEIITDSTPSEPWSYWGLQENDTISNPADPDQMISGKWFELLCRVPVFLEKSGLTYKELDELLNTRFINPGRFAEPYNPEADITVEFADAFCNTDEATITNLSSKFLNKIHRFVRLGCKISWTVKELDLTLGALKAPHLDNPEIDDPFLLKLWYFHRLHSDLKIPVINLLSFWSVINTDNYKDQITSLYDQLFLNKAVLNPEDRIFILNEQRNELENPNEHISGHVEGVLAALGIRDSDLISILGESEVPDVLNLENLSQIYRIVTFSRFLKLSISDFLSTKKLFGIDPFLDPFDAEHLEKTIQFTEQVEKVRDSGFKISELEYLLRHRYRESEGIAPLNDEMALVLGEIRDGLQEIAGENSFVPDPVGELTADRLAWMKWDESHIGSVIGTLDNSRDFSVDLTALPGGNFGFLSELANRIYYDADNKKLHFSGMMTDEEKIALLDLSGHKKYQKAIKDLFEDARILIAERMKAYQLPPFSTPLDDFPSDLIIPEQLKQRIYYDKNARELFFIGWMTEAEKVALLLEEGYEDFNSAIESLFDSPRDYEPEKENRFLSQKDISELTKAANIKGRFEIVLKHLLPYIRNAQSTNFVIQQVANAFKLNVKVAEQTLTHYVILPADYVSGKKAIQVLLSPDFAQSNPNIDLTPSAFPEQFDAYILLHKIALIISKLRITVDDLPLLFQRNPDVWGDRGWADLNFLPLSIMEDPSGLFRSAQKLFDLYRFRDMLLPGEPRLYEILDMAFNPNPEGNSLEVLLNALSKRTGWKLEDIQQLSDWFGYELVDFHSTEALVRFILCFKIIKRLAVSVEKVCDWVNIQDDPGGLLEIARSIKQTAKAKYDNERWLQVAKPLRDDLRDRQRSALVSYLITYYAFRDKTFEDSNDLYAHFLIDPEMDPCMMTSRMKLATSTVQLFIQRCLMNLEQWKIPSASIAQEWSSQWQWMKNYRVWEANRKVFLYPENWIEPELRDDKSPFFKDLENELLQNETTAEHVEKVFLNYLEKLDAVARLEICGMYHEVEKEAPEGIGKNAIDTLHVFGRTRGIPHIYYYRRRIATGGETLYWTPWERVDLDIEGDHLIPVVWNRRLYLFWPVFSEKGKKDASSGGSEAQVQPSTDNKPEIEHSEYEPEGHNQLLSLTFSEDVSVKEPKKYWEIKFAWSQYRNRKWSAKEVTPMHIIPENKRTPEIDKLWAGGNNWPIHLSQREFAFKGFVTNENLIIQCLIHEHKSLRDSGVSMGTYPLFNIEFVGCMGRIVSSDVPDGIEPLSFPYGTDAKGMELIESEYRDEEDNLFIGDTILERTPGIFHLLFPHQYYRFNTQDSFFYQDYVRTFFVTPRGTGVSDQPDIHDPNLPELGWENSYQVQPEQVERFLPDYYEFIPQYEHWEEILPPTFDIDPPIIDDTFSMGAYYDENVGQIPDYDFYNTSAGTEVRRRARTNATSVRTGNTAMAMTNASLATVVTEKTYLFETFYHPFVCEFVKYLNRDGIDGLFQRPVQLLNSSDFFGDTYEPPTDIVDKPYPYEDVDFESDGSYSLYNWEIFFHTPLMVADRLSKNQRFAEAQKWFHYVFDPTDTSTHDVPQKYWKLRPFFEAAEEQAPETLEDLLTKEKGELEKQVNEWRDNPFKPHLIARMRIVAYQKTVVMKYIDNLIAWGDQLFRRDSIESINEATQLYILAAEILGKRPENIQPHTEPSVKTFNDLKDEELDAFSNTMVEMENYLSSPGLVSLMSRAVDMQMFGPSMYFCCSVEHDGQEDNDLLYFCIPRNQKLLSYWDTVADRLFKIRHCMNNEGVVRKLPLFQPPIDPALLVRAVAAGLDIGSALSDLNAPLPHYRFQYMLQKAIELCADVRSLGASLLSALEKKDAEELSRLRSGHEVQLLKAVHQIKKQQIDEAKEAIQASNKALEAAEIRYDYYKNIAKLNTGEKQHLTKLQSAQNLQSTGQGYDIAASIAHLIPEIIAGLSAGSSFGGSHIGGSLRAYGSVFSFLASIDTYQANRASILGSHERRWDDWKLQENLAETETKQIEKQILAAEIRKAIAENDLKNHDLQIENAEEANTFMKDKFTNQELYSWMVSQISTIYFQSYQMAYDIAKRAEKTFRQELGEFEASFINFGYWDNLKKGLLSGEQLHYDLKRMETAYLDKNKREFEITKHISLAMLNPVDLIRLKETGECFVNIPEVIFDLDYPGHYMRRIKSVSLTIPCITGPYTSLNCTLTLLNNSVRIDSSATGEYPRDINGDDPRFRDNIGAIQSIATSHGQNDSGVFDLNFRDERYLPFEGAGAICQWRIELSGKWLTEDGIQEFPQFDFDTISDVILHLRYTSREGGMALRNVAINQLQDAVNMIAVDGTILSRLFSARHEFPGEWQQFLHSPDSQGELNFELYKDRFPFMFKDKTITISRVEVYLKPKDTVSAPIEITLDIDGQNTGAQSMLLDASLGNISYGTIDNSWVVPDKNESDGSGNVAWTIKVSQDDISELGDKIEDLFILFYYSISA